jgi:hypothetical protein
LENPEKKNRQPGDEGKPSADEASGATPVTRAIIEIPDSIIQEYRTNQQQQKRDNKINRWIAISAVAGAWIYAAIAVFQLIAMRHANQLIETAQGLTQETIANADRPWVGIYKMTPINFGVGQRVGAHLVLLNSGKTPATHLHTEPDVTITERYPVDSPPRGVWGGNPSAGGVLFPGQTVDMWPVANNVLTPDQFTRLNEGLTLFVVVSGPITYTDRFGREHSTKFCAYLDYATKAFVACQNGNSAD